MLGALIEESPAACVAFDQNQQLQLANQAARRLFRSDLPTPNDLSELETALGLSSAQREHVKELWQEALKEGESSSTLLYTTGPDAKPRTLSVSLQLRDGVMIFWIQEAPAPKEQRENLFAVISHELRAPLVSIRGYAELVATERLGPLNERQKRGLEIALRNVGHLVELIENVLLHSKLALESGIGRLIRQDLLDLIREVMQSSKAQADEKSLQLSSELPEEPILCDIDRPSLQAALRNLFSNAIKFTEPKGTVLCQVWTADRQVYISLQDSGIGIAKKDLIRIFEPFYQVEGTVTRRFRGAGLGLSLAKKIVTQHRGEIHVESHLERGSRFTIMLPLAE